MNFLAHIFLSGSDIELITGNFIGDFVKGKDLASYPEGIKKGIVLHRKIDEFTDQHKIVLKTKKRLRPKYRHYAPVIADIYYDHFLASKWSDYHSEDLKSYTTSFYRRIYRHKAYIPSAAQHMLSQMSIDDWLYNYQFIEGIDRALTGMSKRTKFDSGMETASQELKENYMEYDNEFVEFFPHLQLMCEQFINA
jgi:acyl carrier protein phosphodiesterase